MYAPDTWHDTTLNHIILTLGGPVLVLPPVSLSARRSAASTIFYDFDMSRPGSELVTSHSPKQTLYRATGAGKRYYTQGIIDENSL